MIKREDSIQMSVGGLTLDPVTKTPIVILKDTDNKLNLPIWIGLLEATAMATEIEGIKMARPMTCSGTFWARWAVPSNPSKSRS